MPRRAWSIRNPGNLAARRELAEAMLDAGADRLDAGLPVLDVGCGMGWFLEALAGVGVPTGTLHGMDADPARVQAARARVPGATIGVGDARRLPFDDHAFGMVSMVVLLSSLQPAASVLPALTEARRVLAPEGVLVVYEPRLPNPFNPSTHLVRREHLDAAGLVPRSERTLTLLPQIGRRLGPLTFALHPGLSRIPALRSHRLVTYRASDEPRQRPAEAAIPPGWFGGAGVTYWGWWR